MLRALVRAALGLFLTSALPLWAPARGSILSSCLKPWKGCPEGGSLSGSRLGENYFAGFSEAMAMYEGGMSDKSGSMCAPHGENGLDRAAPKALATSPAATALRQLYKDYGADGLYADAFDSATIKGAAKAELDSNKYQAGGVHALHAIEQVSYVQSETMVPLRAVQGTIKQAAIATDGRVTAESACTGKPSYSCVLSLEQTAEGCSGETIGGCPLAGSANKPAGIGILDVASAEQAPSNTTKGGVDEEEAAQSSLFKFLAILVKVVFTFGWISVYVVFMFGWVVPRLSSLAKGAAWRSYVGYLLFWPEIALVAAAATSVRGSDYVITKSSKIKTNESPSSSVQSLEQRRVLSGYVMTDSNIRTAVAAWLADASAAESTYGHISTWDVSAVTRTVNGTGHTDGHEVFVRRDVLQRGHRCVGHLWRHEDELDVRRQLCL